MQAQQHTVVGVWTPASGLEQSAPATTKHAQSKQPIAGMLVTHHLLVHSILLLLLLLVLLLLALHGT
jgi:hypothetical protein